MIRHINILKKLCRSGCSYRQILNLYHGSPFTNSFLAVDSLILCKVHNVSAHLIGALAGGDNKLSQKTLEVFGLAVTGMTVKLRIRI